MLFKIKQNQEDRMETEQNMCPKRGRAVSFPIKKPLQKTSTGENLLREAYP